MTCIVALKVRTGSNPRIVIGGDSAGVAGLDVKIRRDPKVFKKGEFLIGYTTSFRMGQIIRFHLSPPPIERGVDLYEYMVTSFVERARTVLKTGGFAEVSNSVEKGGSFVVGIRDRLFSIASDFQVAEYEDDFAALGCGEDYALGALEVLLANDHLTPENIVTRALQVAAKFSGGVRGPFLILSNEGVARIDKVDTEAQPATRRRTAYKRFRIMEAARPQVRAVCTTCWSKSVRQPPELREVAAVAAPESD
jgi:hypothetical protein